jgi:hypothetical protein
MEIVGNEEKDLREDRCSSLAHDPNGKQPKMSNFQGEVHDFSGEVQSNLRAGGRCAPPVKMRP